MPETYDPNRPDFTPYGFSCVEWTPCLMPRPDHHDEIEINLLMSGSITYLMGGRRLRVEAGRLFVFWAAIPHQVVSLNTDTPYYVATIPFAWFLQSQFPEHFVHSILAGEVFEEQNIKHFDYDVFLFRQWMDDLQNINNERENLVVLEMRARMFRLISENKPKLSENRQLPSTIECGGLSKLEKMACFIARNYERPIKIEDICAVVNLHPNYAMNLFKKGFGTTLNDYLTYHRISNAQRLLATTHEKIIDIAYQSGFGSLSQFNTVFKSRCGCTPREYREAHMIGSLS
jgi:AraC family transcriptional regulator, melibiose operon regulatory protein